MYPDFRRFAQILVRWKENAQPKPYAEAVFLYRFQEE